MRSIPIQTAMPDVSGATATAPVPDDAVLALMSWLEHEPVPMIVMDPQYTVLGANAAYRQQFAPADQPWRGHKCYQVSHHYHVPCDQAGEHCPMQRARTTRKPDRVLHIHHTPRGPEHVDVELRPILGGDGEILAYVERLSTVRSASAQPSSEGLVGRSAAFNHALEAMQRVAPSMLPVLLLGESGTGKELFARAVHEASPRARKPFVVVDCSGLTETLFESELFGHEKGAFTGAQSRKPGLVETAQGGTLFLDELGDVPLAMQVKLLRLLESGTYRRVGGVETLTADLRIVAATHKPLARMVADGRFRQDLYYRLNAFPIELPPLRARRDDLPMLVEALLRRMSHHPDAVPLSITPEAMARLQAHDWPGNIRELRNVLERARLFADDGVIRPEHLPAWIGTGAPPADALLAALPPASLGGRFPMHGEDASTSWPAGGAPMTPAQRVAAARSDDALLAAIQSHQGTREALARQLGLSERTLYRRIKALQDAGRLP